MAGSVEVARLIARYIGDTRSFDLAAARVDGKLRSQEVQTKKSGTALNTMSKVGLGLAAVGAFKAAGAFAAYDKELNIFQATVDATGSQMDRARKLAVQLGNDAKLPGVSAADAAAAMTELGKAGLSANQAMDASHGVLELATAGQLENADAASIAANALNTFSLKADQAGRVADLLAGAAIASSDDVTGVADAFRYSAAQATILRIPIEDLTTSIALLANRGVKASVAGTSLRGLFTKMAKPTKEAAGAMEKLGLITKEGNNRFFDAQGRFVGMARAGDVLKEAMGGLTDQQRAYYLQTIFGVAGTRAASGVLLQSRAAWDKTAAAVTKHGNASRLAAANSKGLAGAIEQIKNLAGTMAIVFGSVLAPTLNEVLRTFNAIVGPILTNKVVAGALTIVVAALAAGFIALKVQMLVAYLASGKLIVAIRALTVAMMANPWVAVAVAIVALILVFKKFHIGLDDIWRAVTMAWTDIKNLTFAVWGAIKNFLIKYWPYIVGAMAGPLGLLAALIYRHWNQIKAKTVAIFNGIKNTIVNAFWAVIHFITGLASKAYNAGKEFGEKMAKGVVDGVGSLPGKALGGLGHAAGNFFHKVTPFAEGGVVTRPTFALIGEAGPEAVIPLSRMKNTRPSEPVINIGHYHQHTDTDLRVVANAIAMRLHR